MFLYETFAVAVFKKGWLLAFSFYEQMEPAELMIDRIVLLLSTTA
jgi:hypothetical protein